MITITKLYARSFDLDHTDVFWEIGNFVGNIRQFEFSVLRSESSAGPWDSISPIFQDQYYFRDVSPPKMHKWRTLFYLLRIRDKVTDETADFGPTSQSAEPDLIALEINRQEDLLFREFVGRVCWLFPVRTFGAYCVCFDRVSGRRTKSNCLNCYDTGFLGGYLSPIQCFVQFDPSGQQATPTAFKEKQDNKTTARLISFPQMKPKDIIIEVENTRWRLDSVTTTQRLRSVVHQELTLKEIEKGDVEYKLPVNFEDLRALQPAAERNFTNPQHPDGFADLDSVLAVYGYQPRGTVR
jgi:hypothetical protein